MMLDDLLVGKAVSEVLRRIEPQQQIAIDSAVARAMQTQPGSRYIPDGTWLDHSARHELAGADELSVLPLWFKNNIFYAQKTFDNADGWTLAGAGNETFGFPRGIMRTGAVLNQLRSAIGNYGMWRASATASFDMAWCQRCAMNNGAGSQELEAWWGLFGDSAPTAIKKHVGIKVDAGAAMGNFYCTWGDGAVGGTESTGVYAGLYGIADSLIILKQATCEFWINGVLVHTQANNLPDACYLYPFVYVKTTDALQKQIDLTPMQLAQRDLE